MQVGLTHDYFVGIIDRPYDIYRMLLLSKLDRQTGRQVDRQTDRQTDR